MRQNLKHGEALDFYNNGRVYTKSNYLNGSLTGNLIFYDEIGGVLRTELYENDVWISCEGDCRHVCREDCANGCVDSP